MNAQQMLVACIINYCLLTDGKQAHNPACRLLRNGLTSCDCGLHTEQVELYRKLYDLRIINF